jgi:hypothetical protein
VNESLTNWVRFLRVFIRRRTKRGLVRHERVPQKRHVERRHGWASEAPADERAGKQIGRS